MPHSPFPPPGQDGPSNYFNGIVASEENGLGTGKVGNASMNPTKSWFLIKIARKRKLSCTWLRQKRLFSRFSIQPPFCSTFHDGSFWRPISGLHIVLKVQNRDQPSITYLCSRLYCSSVKGLAIIDLPLSLIHI